jgi:hypothetical protein
MDVWANGPPRQDSRPTRAEAWRGFHQPGSRVIAVAVGAAVLAAAGLAAAAPTGHRLRHHHLSAFGTVVDWRGASHTATVARPSGQLFAIHSSRRIRPGTRVAVLHLTRLGNGTFAGGLVGLGHARHAHVRGIVVATLSGRGFALGARGTTFVVRTPRRNSALSGGVSGSGPVVGTSIVADVSVDSGGDLTEIDLHDVGPVAGSVVEIEGSLVSVDSVNHLIVIARDNDGTSTNYTVHVPPTADLTSLTVGQEMHVLGTRNPDGTYTLAVQPQTLHIEGTITAIDATANAITVKNTDDGITLTFVVNIPTTIDITGFSVGNEVELDAILNADGTYSLVQSSDNGDQGQADDSSGDHQSGSGTWSPPGSGRSDRSRVGR